MPALPIAREQLLAIACTYGTPTYVYSAARMLEQLHNLREALAPIAHRLLYAVKANPQPAILRLFHAQGLGFDAVSPGEMLLLRHLNVPAEHILFSPNFMSDEEMHLAARTGVLLNIGERTRLERFGRAYPGSEVCIRINPNIGAGHHAYVVTAGEETKFGIPVHDLPEVRRIAHRYGLRIRGIHQHIGSGFLEAESLRTAVEHLLAAAADFPELDFINLGGGLGIPYRPEDHPFPLDDLSTRVFPLLEAFQTAYSRPITWWFEPGRYLVGPAGVLLTRVTGIKDTGRRSYAGTDTGMNHLIRPALYGAYHEVLNLSNPEGPPATYTITGNICESGDILARDRTVARLREGDVLAILDAGAYGMSMASCYNLRPLPAEVLVSPEGEPQLLRRRMDPSEFLQWYFGDY